MRKRTGKGSYPSSHAAAFKPLPPPGSPLPAELLAERCGSSIPPLQRNGALMHAFNRIDEDDARRFGGGETSCKLRGDSKQYYFLVQATIKL
jgi:hypothetical protein